MKDTDKIFTYFYNRAIYFNATYFYPILLRFVYAREMVFFSI